jgi:hypothetical protein
MSSADKQEEEDIPSRRKKNAKSHVLICSKILIFNLMLMAHACNPSYLGG